MLVKTVQVGQIGTNCYLLGEETGKVCAVIDPGDDAPVIERMVRQSGLTLTMILLTHGHSDHTLAIPALRAVWPEVPVYIHRADYADTAKAGFHQLPHTEGVRFYDDGDTLKLGALTIEVLHTSGHSAGSVTLKVEDVLFTGDTLFRGSCGRTDLPGGSYDQIMASLKRLSALPGDYRVCPGHEGLSTLEDERRTNYYMNAAAQP
jgi:glyoxylase-like metal-dependent hydrolase (beta-lactamase superfamily II)